MLWDYDSYGRLPRHVKALDVGAFDAKQALFSLAEAREFFVLNEWTEGASYHADLERLAKGGTLRKLDRHRTVALAHYLAQIHAKKRRDANLYKRRLRELIGHGECIMGLTDSYPKRYGFITGDLLRTVEKPATAGDGGCTTRLIGFPRSMGISIPTMCCSVPGLISRYWIGHEENGANRPTT